MIAKIVINIAENHFFLPGGSDSLQGLRAFATMGKEPRQVKTSLAVTASLGRRCGFWKGGIIMVLGIPDFWIWSAFLLCVLSAAACVIYGVVNWNRGMEKEPEQVSEEASWEESEKKVEENL